MNTEHEFLNRSSSSNEKSLYEILGVDQAASQQEIKKAYYKLALRLHPDKNPGDEEAKEKFQQLQKVISILGDEEKRAVYDQTGCVDDDVDLAGDVIQNLQTFLRAMYKNVSEADIKEFEANYRGSDTEKKDLLNLYKKMKGNMDKLFCCMICSDPMRDSHRLKDFIDEAISAGELMSTKAYDKWSKKVSETKPPTSPLKSKKGSEDLYALIAQNGKKEKPEHDPYHISEIIPYIKDPVDRAATSMVSKHWNTVERTTRKHLGVDLFYEPEPDGVLNCFPNVKSLKIAGKLFPRLGELVSESEGEFYNPSDPIDDAGQWILEIAEKYKLKRLILKRMRLNDSDLQILAEKMGGELEVLKLKKCCGFTTTELKLIAKSCRNLVDFSLEGSEIEKNSDWIDVLAKNNNVLKYLNLVDFDTCDESKHIVLLARAAPLVSFKSEYYNRECLQDFFGAADNLEEFVGSLSSQYDEWVEEHTFPPRLHKLGCSFLRAEKKDIIFSSGLSLTHLDISQSYNLTGPSMIGFLKSCKNLECLLAIVDDEILNILGEYAKKLKILEICPGGEEVSVTDTGLVALARGCTQLESLVVAIDISDVRNDSLISIGQNCKKLSEFHLGLGWDDGAVVKVCLDWGLLALLKGCKMLKKLSLYLYPGMLTDKGVCNIWTYSIGVERIHLSSIGKSDAGLETLHTKADAGETCRSRSGEKLCTRCPNLQYLTIRNSMFTKDALFAAASNLKALKYLCAEVFVKADDGAYHNRFYHLYPNPSTTVRSIRDEPRSCI